MDENQITLNIEVGVVDEDYSDMEQKEEGVCAMDLVKIMLGIDEDSEGAIDGEVAPPTQDGSSEGSSEGGSASTVSSETLLAAAKEFREKFKSYQESSE